MPTSVRSAFRPLALVAALGMPAALFAQSVPAAASAPAAAPDTLAQRFVPGIYRTIDEFRAGKPGIGATIPMAQAAALSQKIEYRDARGKRRSIDGMDIWGFSDGVNLYVRLANARRPKEFLGFCRVINFNTLSILDVPNARPLAFERSRSAGAAGSAANGPVRPRVSMGMGVGTGGGFGMSPWGYDPWGWGGGWGSPYGWGSPWGWGASGLGMAMNVPLNRPRNNGANEVAVPVNGVREMYMLDIRDGRVLPLDAVYLPILMQAHDPELFQQWLADTRPNHERSKQLEYVYQYNQRAAGKGGPPAAGAVSQVR